MRPCRPAARRPHASRTRARAAGAVLLAAAAFAAAGCHQAPSRSADADHASRSGSGDRAATGAAGSAESALRALPVHAAGSMSGYTREKFGPAWADVDHNSCDTRDDILKRDLDKDRFRAGTHDCVVTYGVLEHDPYTGQRIVYQRGASKVDIDHMVALGDAWTAGAAQWSADKREQLANDPLNLLAVSAHANRSKGASSDWLPENKAFDCPYVARQIAVKKKYGLSVTAKEKAGMQKVLNTCPKQGLPK